MKDVIDKDKITAFERLKANHSKLCNKLIEFKNNNQELFLSKIGKQSLEECNRIELLKAHVLYINKTHY
jgi:hypothetical protein